LILAVLITLSSCSKKYNTLEDAITPYIEKYGYPTDKNYYHGGTSSIEYESYTYYWNSIDNYVCIERRLELPFKKWYISRSSLPINKEN
jgi:hypothetical protein